MIYKIGFILFASLFLFGCVEQTPTVTPPPVEPPPEEIDLCAEVTCDSYCDGTTYFFDGTCNEGSDLVVCTKKGCFGYQEPRCLDDENRSGPYDSESWKTIIPDSCNSFFDGCNTCTRSEGSDLVACTKKGCFGYQEPRCLDDENRSGPYDSESWKTIIPDSCTSFFDGCNTCTRSKGTCSFSTQENSTECGYVPPKFEFQIDLKECRFERPNKELKLFFTIRTVGENSPPRNSSIWILGDDIQRKVFQVVNKEYAKNQILWGTVRQSAWDYQGQYWTIRDVTDPTQIGDIKLVLCEDVEFLTDTCKEEDAMVLFEGNAVDLCFSEVKIKTSCDADEDCKLINTEYGLDCNFVLACNVDYSKESVISVNKEFFETLRTANCSIEGLQRELCETVIINDSFEPRCFSKVCAKRALN